MRSIVFKISLLVVIMFFLNGKVDAAGNVLNEGDLAFIHGESGKIIYIANPKVKTFEGEIIDLLGTNYDMNPIYSMGERFGESLIWQNVRADFQPDKTMTLIDIRNDNIKTGRGVKVGDPSSNFFIRYGNPAQNGIYDGGKYSWYRYYYNDSRSALKIYFVVDNIKDIIVMIRADVLPFFSIPKLDNDFR